MCSEPVTFGGGITIEKVAPPEVAGSNSPAFSQWLYHFDSTSL
jgi:hypothetical protein